MLHSVYFAAATKKTKWHSHVIHTQVYAKHDETLTFINRWHWYCSSSVQTTLLVEQKSNLSVVSLKHINLKLALFCLIIMKIVLNVET